MELLIQLIGGAIGGNLAGKVLKNFDLGTLWNSVVGILGGGIGGQLLAMFGIMGTGGSAMEIGSIIMNVLSSGVGGGVLLAIVGVIKKAMGK